MGKENSSASLIGKKYQEAIRSYSRQLGDPTLKLNFSQEADAYFRRCALGVWAHSKSITAAHVTAYNSICSPGHVPSQALYFEVSAGVAEPPPFQPPAFFREMIAADRGTKLNRAKQFVDLCSVILMLFASVDDEVTQEEADYITDCLSILNSVLSGQPAPAVSTPSSVSSASSEVPSESKQEEALPTVEELLAQLDSLCGLDKVKKDVRSLINLIKIRNLRKENNLPVPPMSLHLVFMGNPGTGKTTVARLLAGLYRAIGVLPKGQLIEVDRSGLVAGYVGQTALQTQKVIQSALGGVLFIDEAYSLASNSGNDFGQEAIDTILKAMEDHRDELVVIVAGYEAPMARFIHSNPGLESRFNKYFYFDDYNGEELLQIFNGMCEKNGYKSDEALSARLTEHFQEMYKERDDNFGNGRDVRNLFERLISAQSDRVAQLTEVTVDDLMTLTLADFDAVDSE
jgi:SpoVK/Ycf46/Vps4 family AAA+-type ATPase